MEQKDENNNDFLAQNIGSGPDKDSPTPTPEEPDLGAKDKPKEESPKESIVKGLAAIGVVALLLVAFWGTSRVLVNLPDAARSIAAGFVSVTSQFFDADEEDTPIIEDSEEAGEEQTDNDEEGENTVEKDSATETIDNNANNTGNTTGQIEYRIERSPVTSTRTGSNVSDPNGDIDLEITILATGIWDRTDNEFVEKSSVDENDEIAILFEVKNVGTKTSPEWSYRATLPLEDMSEYDSTDRPELAPGARVVDTLRFRGDFEADEDEVIIEVDPARNIDDVERDNNRVTIVLDLD